MKDQWQVSMGAVARLVPDYPDRDQGGPRHPVPGIEQDRRQDVDPVEGRAEGRRGGDVTLDLEDEALALAHRQALMTKPSKDGIRDTFDIQSAIEGARKIAKRRSYIFDRDFTQ